MGGQNIQVLLGHGQVVSIERSSAIRLYHRIRHFPFPNLVFVK